MRNRIRFRIRERLLNLQLTYHQNLPLHLNLIHICVCSDDSRKNIQLDSILLSKYYIIHQNIYHKNNKK